MSTKVDSLALVMDCGGEAPYYCKPVGELSPGAVSAIIDCGGWLVRKATGETLVCWAF